MTNKVMSQISCRREQGRVNRISRREFFKKTIKSAALSAIGFPVFRDIVSLRTKEESYVVQQRNLPGARSNFFGVQTHFGQYRPDVNRVLDLIEHAGITWIRDEVYWAEVEKKKGVFNFPSRYDSYLDEAQARGLQVLLILDFGNPLYLPQEKSGPATEEQREAFARYCREVIKRYRTRGVRHYEIWNEPNASTFWQPRPDADDYLKLLEKAYEASKEADPGCAVIGCSTSGMDADFIERVFSSGGGKFMDAVSVHPYCSPVPPEQHLLDDIEKLRNIVGEKPIWITKFGYPTHTGASGVTEEQQANYLTRTFLLARSSPTIQRVFWYDFQNDGTDPAEPEFNFGLIRKDKSPKPAYKACQTLASLVRDFPLEEYGKKNAAYVYKLEKGKDWVIAAWKMGPPESTNIPVRGRRFRIIERDGEAKAIEAQEPFLKLTVSENIRYIVPAD
jgi:hypothetical protein